MGTASVSELHVPIVSGRGIRVEFKEGSGCFRVITITQGNKSDVVPLSNEFVSIGQEVFKYGKGDQIGESSKTYVVYCGEGTNYETHSIDVINLRPQTTYSIVIYEWIDSEEKFISSDILEVTTGFAVNNERFNITVHDNRTRLPIKDVDVIFTDVREFTSDFGKTDKKGIYKSIPMEEGRYEMVVSCNGYSPKIYPGLFVQRQEPRRDSYYRIFTSAGNTEMGRSIEREYHKNKNDYVIFLDPIGSKGGSYQMYQASPNPSNITKL